MKKVEQKDLETLREHFQALGWTEDDIVPALEKIQGNPKKHTIVMPRHYEEEAKLHAKHHCEHFLGLKKGSENYARAFKEAFGNYLTEAYLNSTGIDTEGLQKQNPTTPRAEAAFKASILAPKSPYNAIISELETSIEDHDKRAAEKFRRSLKSGAMTIAHLYLKYVGGLETKQVSFPDKSMVSAATSFQFLEKTSQLSPDEKEKLMRDIGHKNLMRGLVLCSVLKILEPVFRMDFKNASKLVENKLKIMPASVYQDRGWLTQFHTELEFFLAKRTKELNIEEIINDTFVHVLKTYRPTIGEGTLVESMADAQGATPALTSKAAAAIGDYLNKANIPTEKEEKEILKQSKKILKSTLIPGLSYDMSDLTSPKKKNPTKKAGPAVTKKKKR